jgi:hypothetical protein
MLKAISFAREGRMKIPTVGWAFFGLTMVVLIVYALSLGVFVGSEIEYKQGNSSSYYAGNCKYLYLSGIRKVWGGTTGQTPKIAAEDLFCPVFGSQNNRS